MCIVVSRLWHMCDRVAQCVSACHNELMTTFQLPSEEDLKKLTVGELFRMEDELRTTKNLIVDQLRYRGIIKTNRLEGDIGELIASTARGHWKDVKSYDVETDDGKRIQVKVARRRAAHHGGKLNFSDAEFDSAIIIIFGEKWEIKEAWELTIDEIKAIWAAKNRPLDGSYLTVSEVRQANKTNVTEEMKKVWEKIISQ